MNIDDVVLVCSELITDSLRRPTRDLTVVLTCHHEVVHIEVHDNGSGVDLPPADDDLSWNIIDRVAISCGRTRDTTPVVL